MGTLVAIGFIALAAIPGVGTLMASACLGAALGAAGETLYMAHKEFSSGNVRDAYEMGRDLTIGTFGGFMTGASAVALPIASLFWKMLACAGINTGVNTLQRAAWAEKDGLEDKAGYIFDPEQMMVDFGNGMSIGITVPQLVAMKPKPPGVDVEPPKGLNYDQENTVSSARGLDDVDPPKGSGEGGAVPGTLSNIDARKWYLE